MCLTSEEHATNQATNQQPIDQIDPPQEITNIEKDSERERGFEYLRSIYIVHALKRIASDQN